MKTLMRMRKKQELKYDEKRVGTARPCKLDVALIKQTCTSLIQFETCHENICYKRLSWFQLLTFSCFLYYTYVQDIPPPTYQIYHHLYLGFSAAYLQDILPLICRTYLQLTVQYRHLSTGSTAAYLSDIPPLTYFQDLLPFTCRTQLQLYVRYTAIYL